MTSVVFIVDDDLALREALQSLLRSVGHVVEAFECTRDLLEHRQRLADAVGCLVLDVRLPGQSGLDLQRQLVADGILLPIVFITGHGDVPMSVAAMKAGAIEFLTKPFRDQDLLDAVHRALELDSDRRAAATALAALRGRFDSLTAREREVMALVAAGQMNKQIAAELELAEVTVKVHRAQVMAKMQARSLPELVRMADRLSADGRNV
ncbi:response regulator transcription factor [Roseococcus suduntuyensis]|uniref:FixJ family two-component response regulator n=1 Tax=Roseococcus suduntuyensis TaxID=455361 RepID=A0A840ADQ5_9PROT|nr:response regulator [Roseococcus suduntuyensis]MBB3899261.1 FixJ family two-component response regulator [Roseococcus suduntuyensis]